MENKGNTILIVIISVMAILLVAWLLFAEPNSDEADSLIGEKVEMSAIEKDILDTLNKTEAITLTDDVFKNPAFSQLVDFSRQIVDEPVKRSNPFAPINESEINASEDENGSGQETGGSDSASSYGARTLQAREE